MAVAGQVLTCRCSQTPPQSYAFSFGISSLFPSFLIGRGQGRVFCVCFMNVRFVARGRERERLGLMGFVVVNCWRRMTCIRAVGVWVAFRSALHSHVITLSRFWFSVATKGVKNCQRIVYINIYIYIYYSLNPSTTPSWFCKRDNVITWFGLALLITLSRYHVITFSFSHFASIFSNAIYL